MNDKYTSEQVDACILCYKSGDLNYCRQGIVGLLTEYAALLRERESAKAAVADREAFSRGYVRGYAAALGAAASECRRQAGALDHGGNEYIRYADAIKCAAAIGSLRAPELNELSGNSGQLPMLASARVPDNVQRVADHMARAVEYIEKVYPGARQLDAGPIMRNLRRWSRMLAAAPKPETEE